MRTIQLNGFAGDYCRTFSITPPIELPRYNIAPAQKILNIVELEDKS